MDLVLFGIQGSGKGTQAKRLAAEQNYVIFEAGGELRRIAASGSVLGNAIASFINEGHLVPFEIIMQVVRYFVESKDASQKILFDGIPRDTDQKKAFDEMMSELGRDFAALQLTVNEEESLKRILLRAKEQGRADDASEESIRRRMALFHEKTEPVIKAYAEQGKVVEVSGEGTMDEVYQRIVEALSVLA
jgi:adenylate kinase